METNHGSCGILPHISYKMCRIVPLMGNHSQWSKRSREPPVERGWELMTWGGEVHLGRGNACGAGPDLPHSVWIFHEMEPEPPPEPKDVVKTMLWAFRKHLLGNWLDRPLVWSSRASLTLGTAAISNDWLHIVYISVKDQQFGKTDTKTKVQLCGKDAKEACLSQWAWVQRKDKDLQLML